MPGAPVFSGTNVPIQTLLDRVEAGQTLSEFLKDFPTVSREQAQVALREARDLRGSVTEAASPLWRVPVSDRVGWRGLSPEAIREAALDDLEARTVGVLRETGYQARRRPRRRSGR